MRDSHATVYTVQTKQVTTQTTNRRAHEYISVRYGFHAGNLRGFAPITLDTLGQLPEQYHRAVHEALMRDDAYIVTSYETPIAWFSAGMWFMPDVKYSVTTSKHQAIVKRAIKEGDREH